MDERASEFVKVVIDGREAEVPKGTTILNAARSIGVDIPVFCYHEGLSVAANCRMCLVETNKAAKLQPSCQVTVMPGMEVKTRSPRVLEARKGVLEFILLNHPVDCPICDQAGECVLQDNYDAHSLAPSGFDFKKNRKAKVEDIGPHVVLDAERCILCTRCIRFCDEVAHAHQLDIKHRSTHAEITVYPGERLDNPYSLCTVDLCPVGALTSKDFRFKKRAWFVAGVETVCTWCARGCNLRADVSEATEAHQFPLLTDKAQAVVKPELKPSRIERLVPFSNPAVNRWWACDEGRLAFHWFEQGRATAYAVKGQPVVEESALAVAADALHDGERVDLVVSEVLALEDLWVAFQAARGPFGGRPVYLSGRPEGCGDEVLIRSDRNPNRAGLKLLARHFGLELRPVAKLKPQAGRAVLALCPQDHDSAWVKACEVAGASVVLTAWRTPGAPVTVTLPCASPFERGGLYVSFEGYVQEGRKVLAAPAGVRSPWVHLRSLARAIGWDAAAATREDLVRALLEGVPALKGLDRARFNRDPQRVEVPA
jgi:NADH-quinone oxidoreductase subunit G